MIQRIQTLFIFLAVVAMVIFLVLPIASSSDSTTGNHASLTATEMVKKDKSNAILGSKNTMVLAGLGLVSASLLIFVLFQYKNRQRQVLLLGANMLLLMVVQGFSLYYFTVFMRYLEVGTAQAGGKAGLFAPIFALAFCTLAMRFIRRDMNIVNESNRMR